ERGPASPRRRRFAPDRRATPASVLLLELLLTPALVRLGVLDVNVESRLQRDEEAGEALGDSAADDPRAQEARRRPKPQPIPARRARPGARGDVGQVIDRAQVMRDVLIGEMPERLVYAPDRAVHDRLLVRVDASPGRPLAAE